jgi:hypothetical protein
VHRRLAAVLRRATAHDRGNRYPTVVDFGNELAAVLASVDEPLLPSV